MGAELYRKLRSAPRLMWARLARYAGSTTLRSGNSRGSAPAPSKNRSGSPLGAHTPPRAGAAPRSLPAAGRQTLQPRSNQHHRDAEANATAAPPPAQVEETGSKSGTQLSFNRFGRVWVHRLVRCRRSEVPEGFMRITLQELEDVVHFRVTLGRRCGWELPLSRRRT